MTCWCGSTDKKFHSHFIADDGLIVPEGTVIMTDLISIRDAEKAGITKLRMDHWVNSEDHFEFHVDKPTGAFGPWVKLWSPANEIVGNDNPHLIMILMIGDLNEKCWRKYDKLE